MKQFYFLFLLQISVTSWAQLSDFQKLVLEERLFEKYEISQPYSIPYYWVKDGNKWGVIDGNQKIIIPIAFDEIGAVLKKDTCAAFVVKKNGLSGLYSVYGIKLLAPKYQYIVPDYNYENELIFFSENYKVGVLSLTKGLLFPAENLDIYFAAGRFYLKMENGEKRIYDLDGKRLLSEFTIETIGINWFFADRRIYRIRDYWDKWEKKEFYLVEKDSLYGVFNADLELVLPLNYQKNEIRVRNDTIDLKEGKKWITYFCEPSKVRVEAEFAESRNTPFIIQDFKTDSLLEDLHAKGFDAHILVNFYIDSPYYAPGLNAYSIQEGYLHGILGYDGKFIIPVIYERIGFFRAGRAIVVKEGKYGLINKAGIEVVPTKYDRIEELKLGLYSSSNLYYWVNLNGKYGCIDRNGNEIIPIKYDKFNLNVGILEQQYGNMHRYKDYNYPLDEFGTEPVNGGFEYYNIILEALEKDSNAHYPFGKNGSLTNCFPVKSNGKWGLISIENELKIPPEYDTLYFLSHDLIYAKKQGKTGVLTRDNELFIPFTCDSIYPLKYAGYDTFSYLNPLQLLVYEIGGKKGVFDPVSMKRLAPIYDEIETSWHIIDYNTQSFFLSEGYPAYQGYPGQSNLNFHDNSQYLRYRIGNQYGLINTFTIEDLTPKRYSKVELFRGNEYAVRLDEKMTFILPLSGTLMQDIYDSVKVSIYYKRSYHDFSGEQTAKINTYFIIQKGDKWGVLNFEGVSILPAQYEDITAIHPRSEEGEYDFIVKQNGKFGIVNQDGTVLIPFKYDSIEHHSNSDYFHSYLLVKNDKTTLLEGDDPRLNKERVDKN